MSDTDVRPSSFASTDRVPLRAAADLWLLRAADVCASDDHATALAAELLDRQERQQASVFRQPADKARYVAAHVSLRLLLAERVGVPARDLVYTREPCPCCGEPHGRPALADMTCPLHFSLSHGGDLVLIGIAETPIGVDVEPVPRGAEVEDLTPLMHPAERLEIDGCAPADRPLAFAGLWTRKEAYLKGLGTGLGRNPDADYLGTSGLAALPSGWTVANLAAGPGHAAAYAVRDRDPGDPGVGLLRELPSGFAAAVGRAESPPRTLALPPLP
ncbi:4'-phosphopantetheinyl transferase [Streptacidiphilus sp. MAP12-33]|uniref:4'-phosphopantetheinyl transferase family protein n=1 Tax=Streptacidiphilus sp. MAP12-33 TaxID=3156266 RepID=UPI0035144BD2